MAEALPPILLVVGIICAMLWLITRINYQVDSRFIRVVLGKLTLRKIALSDVAFVDCKVPFWNEHWCNTLFAGGRVLRVRRKSGWMRNFIITPANRDEILQQLACLLDSRLDL